MTTPTYGNLGQWLLSAEASDFSSAEALADATERVCQKLYAQVARLVALEGSRALFTRSLVQARAAFPFLEGVYIDHSPEHLLVGLSEHVQGVEVAQVGAGLAAIITNVLALLATFIGDDLTVRLVRDPWPEVPFVVADPASGDV